ncbi:MAG: alpha/beta hydrolase family protein [Rickettsiales bacterium]
MTYLSRNPFTPPPYAEMERALMRGTTEAMYDSSVANYQALKEVCVSAIAYDSDGLRVTGIEALPELRAGEKIPLLIYNRGGSGDYGMLSAGQVNVLMMPFVQRMRVGVLASNYRGNGGSEGHEEWGAGDVRDVLNLLELGKQQPWWDGVNLFMLGWSRGGMMTYRAMQEGAVLNAAVVGAGLADAVDNAGWRDDMKPLYEKYIPGYAADPVGSLEARSAVYWPEDITAPLLLLHGDADDRVHVNEARMLYAKLQALGKDVQYIEYPGGDHGLKREWKQWTEAAIAWFTKYRKPV